MKRCSRAWILVVSVFGCESAPSDGLGLRVTELSLSQGVEQVVYAESEPVAPKVPVIAGRDALLRVFYETDGAGEELFGTLELEDDLEPIEVSTRLEQSSKKSELESTVNFRIPGDRIKSSLPLSVTLFSERIFGGAVRVEGPQNTLRVVLVPFSYQADGSGRIPDLSSDQVEQYRERLSGIYPVSNVEISVRDVVSWPAPIKANGEGWQNIGFELFELRQNDEVADDVYYYGVFDPAESIHEYCDDACLIGLTVWNDDPVDTGKVDLRLALGVGFPEVAVDSAAHELGHAHGLRHAPCGPNLDPASIDPNYPYERASIGVVGYDFTSDILFSPSEATDIMGYCEDRWISDYHFAKLIERGMNVNQKSLVASSSIEYEVIGVDAGGRASWAPTTIKSKPLAGRRIEIKLEGPNAERIDAVGFWLPYDHLPGGWVLAPKPTWRAVRAQISGAGLELTAAR